MYSNGCQYFQRMAVINVSLLYICFCSNRVKSNHGNKVIIMTHVVNDLLDKQ